MNYAFPVSGFFMGVIGDRSTDSNSLATVATAATDTFHEQWLYSEGGAYHDEAAAFARIACAAI